MTVNVNRLDTCEFVAVYVCALLNGAQCTLQIQNTKSESRI